MLPDVNVGVHTELLAQSITRNVPLSKATNRCPSTLLTMKASAEKLAVAMGPSTDRVLPMCPATAVVVPPVVSVLNTRWLSLK